MDHNITLASTTVFSSAQASQASQASGYGGHHKLLDMAQHKTEPKPQQNQHRVHSFLPPFASLSLCFSPSLPIFSSSSLPSRPSLSAVASPPPSLHRKPSSLLPSSASMPLDLAPSPSFPTSKPSKSRTAFPDYQRLPDPRRSFPDPPNIAALRRSSIVWFRNDLRSHDNEALFSASKESISILPVYCFDPRDYGKSSSGFDKTGPYRAKFLLECVSDLRNNLRERGSDLVVRVGKPEEVLASLAKSIGADALYAHQEVSCDEIQCENKVSAALQEEGVEVKYFWGSTLFHMEDLPFKLDKMPITYSGFRETVQNLDVRQTLETPKQLKGIPIRGGVKPGDIPTLQELGLRPVSAQRQEGQNAAASSLIGGETEALKRLKSFAADHFRQSSNKVGNGGCGDSLYGSNFSCKISPWLAMGCLSPRRMFEDLKSNEKSCISASAGANSNDNGLNWLVFELLWRDFFRFITKKYAMSKHNSEVITATPSTAAVPV